jgi:hypothetical protein
VIVRDIPTPSRARRVDERLLFLTTFLAFAWFHQGGGWNQNSRFAMVRSIVEERTFFIDSYLVYLVPRSGDTRFVRPAVRAGELDFEANRYALGWVNEHGRLVPIAGSASPNARVVDVAQAAVTGDLSYYRGHFHPGKAPGTSLLAVPAYFLLFHAERALGLDPDEWRTLTVNAWLTSVLTVALLSAIGVVLFYRLALRVSSDDRTAALMAALTLAFGTMYLPYATMFFEANIIAVAMLASWYFAHVAREAAADARGPHFLSGLCAGYAAITNYIMVVAVLMIAAYLLLPRKRRGWLWFGLGVLGPFLLICAYNVVCFGTPFTTNYRYEHPMFLTSGAFLGVFGPPDFGALAAILVSPFRGLFFTAPVLLMGIAGLVWMWRNPRLRADAILCAGMAAFLIIFNITFVQWHAGWTVGPRYLAPAIPFFAFPLVFAYRRAAKLTAALAVVSVAMNLVITAVDPQAPVGTGVLASIPGRPLWTYNPVSEYELPLLLTGRAGPLLDKLSAVAVREGNARPLALASITGHVSVNPIGVYEASFFTRFGPHTIPARWNAFNAGEFLAPESMFSLLPLLLLSGGGVFLLMRRARSRASPPAT